MPVSYKFNTGLVKIAVRIANSNWTGVTVSSESLVRTIDFTGGNVFISALTPDYHVNKVAEMVAYDLLNKGTIDPNDYV